MKALFIINPMAGKRNMAKEITRAIVDTLKTVDGLFEIKVALKKGMARELASAATDRGYDAVYACGGDGTIHEVAAPLVNSQTALGIIPCGGGNGFAKSLGIAAGLEPNIGLLKSIKTREIDVGMIGDRFFFGTAGLGFDAHLSKKYNDGLFSKRIRGLLPYIPLALWEFYSYTPRLLHMKMDNSRITETPFILTFANTERYGGDAIIAPGALPDDGLLDVCTVPELGLLEATGFIRRLFKGTVDTFKGYRCTRAGKVEVEQGAATYAHADGEPFAWKGNISVEVLPRGLRVLTA